MSGVRYDKGVPKRDLKYDIIIRTSNIDITELDVLLDLFRDRVWSVVRDVSNRNRFDVPWDALKPEYQEFYVPSHRQVPIGGSEDLGSLGPPLAVRRLENPCFICSLCEQSQRCSCNPSACIQHDGSRELSTCTSSVDDTVVVSLGDSPSVPAMTLLPHSPPVDPPGGLDSGNLPDGFVPFYDPTAEVADLALALAQKAGVDSCPKDLPVYGED